jgi:hypothetical protein
MLMEPLRATRRKTTGLSCPLSPQGAAVSQQRSRPTLAAGVRYVASPLGQLLPPAGANVAVGSFSGADPRSVCRDSAAFEVRGTPTKPGTAIRDIVAPQQRSRPTLAAGVRSSASPLPDLFSGGLGGRNQGIEKCAVPCRDAAALES